MKKIYYLSAIIGIFIIIIITRILTVETELVGIEKVRVIIPKTVKAKINNIKSKIFEGKRVLVKDFEVDGIKHEFYKYYISEENKEVSLNKPTGYLEQFEDKVLFVSGGGNFSFLNVDEFGKKKIILKKINNNFIEVIEGDPNLIQRGPFGIRDITIINNFLYLSYQKRISDDCYNLAILRSQIDFTFLKFEEFFTFNECSNKKKGAWAVLSGGRIVAKDNNIFFTIGEMALRDIAQNNNSYFGKLIKINIENPIEHQVVAKGLRNAQGLFYDKEKKLFFITDHAEVGGDEINIFKESENIKNFGWPLASYGKPYNNKSNNYFKSHKENGFIEPAFYFKKENIGISQFIDYDLKNDKLRYILTSLRAKSIFFLNYESENKLTVNKEIFLGERVRDIIKLKKYNKYLLVLETSPSIGVIRY